MPGLWVCDVLAEFHWNLSRGRSTSHCFYRFTQTINCLYFVIKLSNNVKSNRLHPDTVCQWTSISSWGEFSGHRRSRRSERTWTKERRGWGWSALDRPQHLTVAGDHESESRLLPLLPVDKSEQWHLTFFECKNISKVIKRALMIWQTLYALWCVAVSRKKPQGIGHWLEPSALMSSMSNKAHALAAGTSCRPPHVF